MPKVQQASDVTDSAPMNSVAQNVQYPTVPMSAFQKK